jgi:hypothetical protein
LPLAALMFAEIRHSSRALRIVGASILAGVVLRDFWLLAPSAVASAAPAAALALAALGSLFLDFSSRMATRLTLESARHDA